FDNDGALDVVVVGPDKALLAGRPQDYASVVAGWLDLAGAHNHRGLVIEELIEGTYLRGHGVVYSVSLPVHFAEVMHRPAQPARNPLSDGERVRGELRGDKVEAAEPPPPRHQETVANSLLKILAENGHHFTQLPENEQLTVAITLRQSQACTVCH